MLQGGFDFELGVLWKSIVGLVQSRLRAEHHYRPLLPHSLQSLGELLEVLRRSVDHLIALALPIVVRLP